MSDLDASYVENRAAQNLSNMGELENTAPNMKFEQTAIEQVDGEFQKVGRNPDQGVAAVVGNYNKQDKTSGATYLDHGAALDKAARTGVTNVREDGEYWVGDEEGVGQVIIDKVAGKGSGETLNPSDISTIEQFQEALKNGDGTEVRNADLTFREKGQGIITKFLNENFNIDEQKAFGHALRIMGTTSDDPRAAELGLGLVDLTPAAVVLDIQEGIRLYQQGKATDSATDQVVGGVVTFLGALSVIPAASAVTKAAKKLFNSGKADEAMSVIQQFIADETGSLKAPGQVDQPQGPFVSQVEQTVQGLKQEKGTATQMRSVIAKAPGVKAEEMAWIGLDDFLAGNKKVSKQDVSDFVAQNKVNVQEVTKTDLAALQTGDPFNEVLADAAVDKKLWDQLDTGFEFDSMDEASRIAHLSSPEISSKIDKFIGNSVRNQPKFGEYVLPGGENYREVLITTPPTGANSNFIGSHFNEPNILAHIRMNDRTGPDGEKILFIEEIQSDWHQTGRKKGYQGQGSLDGLTTEDLMKSEGWDSIAEDGTVTFTDGSTVKYADQSAAEGELLRNYISAISNTFGQVPNAPLKKTWHETAFRRAAAIASDEGYDAIAWTPGQVQADRYDLSKTVESVSAEMYDDGIYSLGVYPKNGSDPLVKDVPDAELENFVGKEMADKIRKDVNIDDGVEKVYDGLDLKVGGEGMKSFYDKMIKNYASKFGKKFKSKVGVTGLSTPRKNQWTTEWSDKFDGYVVRESDGVLLTGPDGKVFSAADEASASVVAEDILGSNTNAAKQDVWSMPITDKMRSSLKENGTPLFSAVAAPTALGATQEDQSQDIQVTSAANKFLQEVVGRTAASKVISKEARIAQDLISGNYKNFVDDIPVEGTDFNFERMDTSDELKNQINAVSFVYEDTIDAAKKGVVPHDVTKDLAELLGQDMDAAEAAVKSLPGDVEDLHVRALTMRKLLVGSAQKTDELARKIQAGGPDVSDGDYLRFREQIVRHSQLQAQMKGVQTEIGRALSSFRIPSAAYERNPQIAEELINQIGGKETSREMAERWLTTPIDRRADFAARSAFARTKDAVYEVWINGLLSGLRTHQVNTVGNTVFTMFQIPERVLAAGVGSVFRNPDRVRFREAYAMARGSAEGVVDGIKLAWKTWKDEMPQDGISKIEAQQMKAITPENFNVNPDSLGGKAIDYIGQGVRLPGRALMTADEFYKAVGYRSELRAVSMRKMLQARDEGLVSDLITDISQTAKAEDAQRLTELRKTSDERNLNGDELSELMDIMIENPTKEIDMAAHDYATYITFQSELGEAGKAIQSAASRIPGGRVIIPFIRTPTNIIKEFARRSPLAAAMPSTYKALQAGGPARDLAIARIGVGTSLMTWAYFLATDGKITGGGPSKKSGTYAQWRETHEPYSMKIDGKWYPYGRIEPLAMLFGSTADAVDFIQYSSDQDAADKVYIAAFTGVMQNIGSKTFLRGISDVSDAFTDPARYGESYVANMARTTIPFSSMTRDITRANDPVMRETRAFGTSNDDNPINVGLQRILNEMKASTPGFSNDLPPKRTFWGKERYAYEGGPATSFYAFSSKGVKHSPIDDEMVRLNTPLNMPSKRVGQYELNPQQYDRLVVLMNKTPEGMNSIDLVLKYGNKTMRSAMNNLVQSELWKQVQSDDVKIHYLKSIRNDYIDAAKQALSLEDSAIGDAKLQEDTDKMLLESEKGFIKPLIGTSTQIGVN